MTDRNWKDKEEVTAKDFLIMVFIFILAYIGQGAINAM